MNDSEFKFMSESIFLYYIRSNAKGDIHLEDSGEISECVVVHRLLHAPERK